jgi:hypothetical protein
MTIPVEGLTQSMTAPVEQPATLAIPRLRNKQWGNYLIDCVVNSGRFHIEHHDFPPIRNLRRGGHLKPLLHDGKLILIDDWDYAHPTCNLNEAFYESNPYYRDVSLILKVQYSSKDKNLYPSVPVVPFSIFPRSTFQLSVFEWKGPGKHITSFSGRCWRQRRGWVAKLKEMPDVHLKLQNPDPGIQQEYYDMLSDNTWGLVLKGKGNGGKNRREMEYMSCGMPLALNYIPEYPFAFVPDVDFLYLQTPQDLGRLQSMDPRPFAERSVHNYKMHFSPDAIARTFEMLVRNHL